MRRFTAPVEMSVPSSVQWPSLATSLVRTTRRRFHGLDWSVASLAALFSRTAADEARHAALAFETAPCVSTRGDVAPVLDEERDRALSSSTPAQRARLAPLFDAALQPRARGI